MSMKKRVVHLSTVGVLVMSSLAEANNRKYPEVYPFIPMSTDHILNSVKKMSEDKDYIHNFQDQILKGLTKGETFKMVKGKKQKNQPWTSTYWPLNRGLIADAYDDSALGAYNPFRLFSWEHNRDRYLKRAEKVHQKIDSLTSEELEKLAPSEKYDLLLGDKSFGLTNKVWAYMQSWGSMKEYGMLHSLDKVGGKSIDRAEEMMSMGWYNDRESAVNDAVNFRGGLAEKYAQELVNEGKYSNIEDALNEGIQIAEREKDNFVLKKKNDYMATWEGICHGWSTAAGLVPRPRKSVSFKLPDGRRLKFYPEDIKGLISYLWANSLIQDGRWIDDNGNAHGGGILMQGLRCNEKSPKKDEWGRFYDHRPDFFSKKLEPRCVGVHPAIWHMGLVNIVGKQGRSFIVERKVKAAVDNHPLYKYKMEFFNPYNAEYVEDPLSAIMPVSEHDQFKDFRNPEAKFIIGVKTTMTYLDWARPKREETDSEEDDSTEDKEMLYDLELDAQGNIIGGQWRAREVGKPDTEYRRRNGSVVRQRENLNHSQPDFFWVVTKEWKNWFKNIEGLESWTDTRKAPPASWKEAAKGAHNFIYHKTFEYGFNEKCDVIHKDTDEVVKVPCEYKISQPQPLINLVHKLIELSQ